MRVAWTLARTAHFVQLFVRVPLLRAGHSRSDLCPEPRSRQTPTARSRRSLREPRSRSGDCLVRCSDRRQAGAGNGCEQPQRRTAARSATRARATAHFVSLSRVREQGAASAPLPARSASRVRSLSAALLLAAAASRFAHSAVAPASYARTAARCCSLACTQAVLAALPASFPLATARSLGCASCASSCSRLRARCGRSVLDSSLALLDAAARSSLSLRSQLRSSLADARCEQSLAALLLTAAAAATASALGSLRQLR